MAETTEAKKAQTVINMQKKIEQLKAELREQVGISQRLKETVFAELARNRKLEAELDKAKTTYYRAGRKPTK